MPCKREGRKAMVKTNLSYALSNPLWLFFHENGMLGSFKKLSCLRVSEFVFCTPNTEKRPSPPPTRQKVALCYTTKARGPLETCMLTAVSRACFLS